MILVSQKLDLVTTIFTGKGITESHNIEMFKCQYLSQFLRYMPHFLEVIMNLIGFKITFSNMGSYSAPSLISGV